VTTKAKTVKLDPAEPDHAFSRCREIVESGGVIAYPTDTFYGLGADPRNHRAVKKLFEIKGRTEDQPILLLIADAEDVREWASSVPPRARELMERYWPGPLTLILSAKPDVLPELTARTGAIGLRVPGSELTRGLLRYLGRALTGTSANRSGKPSPRTAAEAEAAIGDAIDLILDGGDTAGGQPSTVVDAKSGSVKVLRKGAIPLLRIDD